MSAEAQLHLYPLLSRTFVIQKGTSEKVYQANELMHMNTTLRFICVNVSTSTWRSIEINELKLGSGERLINDSCSETKDSVYVSIMYSYFHFNGPDSSNVEYLMAPSTGVSHLFFLNCLKIHIEGN